MSKRIYLSGPIDGLTHAEATGWRDHVAYTFNQYRGIVCHDPMRHVVYRNEHVRATYDAPVTDDIVPIDESLFTDRGITLRDYTDTVNSDLLFVNLLDVKKVSIGTVIEIAWAAERRIPVIVVMEPAGNPHDHPMLREQISFRVPDLNRAVKVALSVLNVDEKRGME